MKRPQQQHIDAVNRSICSVLLAIEHPSTHSDKRIICLRDLVILNDLKQLLTDYRDSKTLFD